MIIKNPPFSQESLFSQNHHQEPQSMRPSSPPCLCLSQCPPLSHPSDLVQGVAMSTSAVVTAVMPLSLFRTNAHILRPELGAHALKSHLTPDLFAPPGMSLSIPCDLSLSFCACRPERRVGFIENTARRHRRGGQSEVTETSHRGTLSKAHRFSLTLL